IGVSRGIAYMHNEGIIHRDLKAENILIMRVSDFEVVPKICDFGTARPTPQDQCQMTSVGTWEYMAPELTYPNLDELRGLDEDAATARRREKVKIANRVDTWSFGCVLWEMITSQPAFYGCDRF
ncbi:hypothetical protein PFISCL1PPCAC_7171, partial [Pristionchus fissidentatus]